MSCLLAILLYTGLDSSAEDRLVLSYEAYGQNSYGSFNVNRSQLFPQPHESARIFKTPTRVEGAGTYIAAYCTFEAEPMHMYYYITKLASGDISGYHTPSKDPPDMHDCLLYLHSQYRSMKGPLEDRVVNQIEDREFYCTEKKIISLALDGHIRLTGTIDLKTTLHSTDWPLVSLQRRLHMNKFTTNGKFIRVTKINGDTYALAWINDHLRLFKHQPRGNVWEVTSGVSHETSTGTAICGFLRHAYSQINEIVVEMDLLRAAHDRLLGGLNRNDASDYRESISRLKAAGRKLMVAIERPVTIPATGYLGGVIST